MISRLINFLKELPDDAIYSSVEEPPKGTKVFQTDRGTDYWVKDSKTSSRESTDRGWPKTVVGSYVLNNIDKKSSILDFGSGKKAAQTARLKEDGFETVVPYDFQPPHNNPEKLDQKYDVVMASNVLNVQASDDQWDETMASITGAMADAGKVIANFPSTPRKHSEMQSYEEITTKLSNHFGTVERVGGAKSDPIFELSDRKLIKEGGDGGGASGGGFGDSGGTAFTSSNAGVFTPTYSERAKQPKKKKKVTGIERLNDFLTDGSPERKMEKSDSSIVDLLNWVKLEMRKEGKVKFHRQANGDTGTNEVNIQVPRVNWAENENSSLSEDEDPFNAEKNPVVFDAEPDETAAQEQSDITSKVHDIEDTGDSTVTGKVFRTSTNISSKDKERRRLSEQVLKELLTEIEESIS